MNCGNLEWSPLNDWNACFEVVAAVQAKGWFFALSDVIETNEMQAHFHCPGLASGSGYDDDGRRAILRAALLAVQSEVTT